MKKLLPPQVAMFCLLVMVIIATLTSLPIGPAWPLRVVGGLLALFGLMVSVKAKSQFQTEGTPVNTFDAPRVLIKTGCFRWSRNPMYLGMFLLLFGVALLLNSLLSMMVPLLFLALLNFWYIPFEERAARKVFGQSYDDYCVAVRKWL